MTKRIPIKALKDLSKQYGIEHAILFAHTGGEMHHVVTYGRTKEGCSQAADFGNKLKTALGWSPALQSEPPRVKKLQQRVKELQSELLERKIFSIADLKNKYLQAHLKNNERYEYVFPEKVDAEYVLKDFLDYVEDQYNKEHTTNENTND